MTEAAIHTLFEIEMIEWVDEVSPIEMSVDAEHLAKDGLADLDKFGGKATAFTSPITRACKL